MLSQASDSPTVGGYQSSFQRVLSALEATTGRVRVQGATGEARCPMPSHTDTHASMRVLWKSRGLDGGQTLLYCHACKDSATGKDLAEAMGLTLADLFDEPLPPKRFRKGRSPQQEKSGARHGKLGALPARIAPRETPDGSLCAQEWNAVAVTSEFVYLDAQGAPRQKVQRYDCTDGCESGPTKTFRQRYMSASGRWVGRKPAEWVPVLYRLPELVAAVADGTPVWVLEGEKDVERARELGLVATTNPGGATGGKSDWEQEFVRAFTGAADVRVVLDRDDAGYARGVFLADLFAANGVGSVRLYLPATQGPKSDFSDHVDAGHSLDDLEQVHVDEVRCWVEFRGVRDSSGMIDADCAEVGEHLQQAQQRGLDEKKRALHEKRAQRWARQLETNWLSMAVQMDTVRSLATECATPWTIQCLELGERELSSSRALVAGWMAEAGVSVPPALQLHEAPLAVTTTVDPDDGVAHAGSGTPEKSISGLIQRSDFRIVDGCIVQAVYGRGKDSDGQDDSGQKFRLVLDRDVRIVEIQRIETDEQLLSAAQLELMGRSEPEGSRRRNVVVRPPIAYYTLEFVDPETGEQMEVERVSADDWEKVTWVHSVGAREFDSRPGGLARIRDAVRTLSRPKEVTVHRSTGWRRGEDGSYFYVHARGVITAQGNQVASVKLDGVLRNFDLPDPISDGVRLREAFDRSVSPLVQKLSGRVGVPLIGTAMRAAVGINPWVVTLLAPKATYKTGIAALTMHFYGERWDRRCPASSMSGRGDTLNALRLKMVAARNALLWIDDSAPTAGYAAAQVRQEETARVIHNGEVRGRADRSGEELREGLQPVTSGLLTSEVTNRPGSAADRMFVIPLDRSQLNVNDVIALDTMISRYDRALLMASMLQWVAGNYEHVMAKVDQEVEDFAKQWRDDGQLARVAEGAAQLWAGWVVFTDFLRAVGAIDEGIEYAITSQVNAGIREAAMAAIDPDMASSVGGRVRELLCHALDTGLAHVCDATTGDQPRGVARQLGWKSVQVGQDEFGNPRYRLEAKGIPLGYLSDAKGTDGPEILCNSTTLEAVLKAAATSQIDNLQMDRATAIRALHDVGIVVGEKRVNKPDRLAVQRHIPCLDEPKTRRRRTALRLDRLLNGGGQLAFDDEGDGPDDGGGSWDIPPAHPAPAPATATLPAAVVEVDEQPVAVVVPAEPVEVETARGAAPAGSAGEVVDLRQSPANGRAVGTSRRGVSVSPDSVGAGRGPAAIVDVDGVWMADGSRSDLPQIRHIGDIAEIGMGLGLSTRVTRGVSEPGQVWVTEAACEQLLGIAVGEMTADSMTYSTQLGELTHGLTSVTDALADGWQIGGKGDRLGTWSRVWRSGQAGVRIALMAGMDVGVSGGLPILADDPAPAVLARRLARFAAEVGAPFHVDPGSTGIDLLIDLRRKDKERFFTPVEPCPPAMRIGVESELNWSRKPTADEAAMLFVHSYDRSGSYLAGSSSVQLGIGEPTHMPQGCAFDQNLPGYWLVVADAQSDWRLPNPLVPRGSVGDEPVWVTTPTLQLSYDLGYRPVVIEAWVWEDSSRILEPWYKRLKTGREVFIASDDPDDRAAYGLLKTTYSATIGRFSSRSSRQAGWAPDRRHHVIGKSRSNVVRRIAQIGRDAQVWPLAASVDTVVYASNDPDPIGAWPGEQKNYGTALGSFKWKASGLMSEHLPKLTGGQYRGEALLTAEWDPTRGGPLQG